MSTLQEILKKGMHRCILLLDLGAPTRELWRIPSRGHVDFKKPVPNVRNSLSFVSLCFVGAGVTTRYFYFYFFFFWWGGGGCYLVVSF